MTPHFSIVWVMKHTFHWWKCTCFRWVKSWWHSVEEDLKKKLRDSSSHIKATLLVMCTIYVHIQTCMNHVVKSTEYTCGFPTVWKCLLFVYRDSTVPWCTIGVIKVIKTMETGTLSGSVCASCVCTTELSMKGSTMYIGKLKELIIPIIVTWFVYSRTTLCCHSL